MTAQQLSVMLSGLGDNEVVIKQFLPFSDGIVNANITGIEIGYDKNAGKVFLNSDFNFINNDITI